MVPSNIELLSVKRTNCSYKLNVHKKTVKRYGGQKDDSDFFDAAFLNTPSKFFRCHLSPPNCLFWRYCPSLNSTRWLLSREKFTQHSGSPVVANFKDACYQSFGATGVIFRTSRDFPVIARISFQ